MTEPFVYDPSASYNLVKDGESWGRLDAGVYFDHHWKGGEPDGVLRDGTLIAYHGAEIGEIVGDRLQLNGRRGWLELQLVRFK